MPGRELLQQLSPIVTAEARNALRRGLHPVSKSCIEAPVDDALGSEPMLQDLQHLAKNTQGAKTLVNLITARSQNSLVYGGADCAFFRIVAAMEYRHDLLGFLIELTVEDRDDDIECLAPILVKQPVFGKAVHGSSDRGLVVARPGNLGRYRRVGDMLDFPRERAQNSSSGRVWRVFFVTNSWYRHGEMPLLQDAGQMAGGAVMPQRVEYLALNDTAGRMVLGNTARARDRYT